VYLTFALATKLRPRAA